MNRRHTRTRIAALLGFLASQWAAPADAQILANLSFEQLSRIEVTTAARRPESLFDTTAAVAVLTGDEVRRSGADTLQDALRHVPGMDVTRIQSLAWGVGARGFSGPFANQLLVMIDGRSVYNPTFGGVFWPSKDVFFDDLDRIEVVRGPGGSLWGANALNGVINVVTKDARDTQGGVFSVSGGSFHEAGAAARYGFTLNPVTFARLYVKADQFGPMAGGREDDPWRRVQTGFRLDRHASATSHLTVQGDFYETFQNNPVVIPTFMPPFSTYEVLPVRQIGANALVKWRTTFTDASVLTVQGYWDFTAARNQLLLDRRNVGDLEIQHDVNVARRHALTYGMNYRALPDRIEPSRTIRIPGRETAFDQLFSIFAQDEITLAAQRVFLTLGAKFEHNPYSSWETQPTLRLRVSPTSTQMVWAAVSQAVATPNRTSVGVELDSRVLPPNALGPGAPAVLVQIQGRSDRSEELTAYEIGYRVRPTPSLSLDVATFYNDYSELRVLDTRPPVFTRVPAILPIAIVNMLDGTTYGVETKLGWEPVPSWRLEATHSFFQSDVLRGALNRADGNGSPKHKITARASATFDRWTWDAGLRSVDKLPSVQVASYLVFDTRLAWHPSEAWELAIVGRDLSDHRHSEYPPVFIPGALEVPRWMYGTMTFRF